MEIILDNLAEDPPWWVMVSPMWDETKERLQFKFRGKTLKQTVEVFVLKCWVAWGWGSDRDPQWLQLIMPPVPLTSTSAHKLIDAMRNHYFTRNVWNFRVRLLELAGVIALLIGVIDQASSNNKAVAIEALQFPKWCAGYIACMSHQTMLCVLDMSFAVFGASFIKGMHSSVCFINKGTHRLRMLLMVRPWVEKAVDIQHGMRNPIDALYASELTEYLTLWHDVSTPTQKRKRRKKTPHASKQADGISKYFRLVHEGYHSTRMVVKTLEPITPALRARVVDEITDAVSDHMVFTQFPCPSTAKWTKTGPANDRFVFASQNDVLNGVLDMSTGKMQFKLNIEVDERELDASWAEWNKVTGSQHKTAKEFTGHKDQRAKSLHLRPGPARPPCLAPAASRPDPRRRPRRPGLAPAPA